MVKKRPISRDEAEQLLELLKKQGLLKLAVLAGSKQDVTVSDFLLNFCDFEKSPYIAEKFKKVTRYP